MANPVRLIYLDTSHLDLLARVRKLDSASFAAFHSAWRAIPCVLVVSRTHLLETRLHGDPEARNARYELFSALTPIVSDIAPPETAPPGPGLLVGREIFRAFVRLGMVRGTGPGVDELIAQWCAIFPGSFSTAEEAATLRVMEEPIFGRVASISYAALTTGTRARARDPKQKYRQHRLDELPDARPSREQIDVAEQQMLQALDDPALWVDLVASLPSEAIEELKRTTRELCLSILKRQAEVGPRTALMEQLVIDQSAKLPHEPLDMLLSRSLFRSNVEEILDKVAPPGEGADRAMVLDAVKFEDCPGTWLRNQVESQLRKGTPMPRPSDEYDLEHIAYLPYVDLLLADRRIVEFTNQVLRRSELPSLLRGVSPPLRAHTVEKIVEAIQSRFVELRNGT